MSKRKPWSSELDRLAHENEDLKDQLRRERKARLLAEEELAFERQMQANRMQRNSWVQ